MLCTIKKKVGYKSQSRQRGRTRVSLSKVKPERTDEMTSRREIAFESDHVEFFWCKDDGTDDAGGCCCSDVNV